MRWFSANFFFSIQEEIYFLHPELPGSWYLQHLHALQRYVVRRQHVVVSPLAQRSGCHHCKPQLARKSIFVCVSGILFLPHYMFCCLDTDSRGLGWIASCLTTFFICISCPRRLFCSKWKLAYKCGKFPPCMPTGPRVIFFLHWPNQRGHVPRWVIGDHNPAPISIHQGLSPDTEYSLPPTPRLLSSGIFFAGLLHCPLPN